MSDPASTAQRQQTQRRGFIVTLVTLPLRMLGVLVVSLVLSIVTECIGMHLFWPEQEWRHAQSMLTHELEQLSHNFTRSAIVQEPGRTAHQVVERSYHWVFVKTGLAGWMQDSSGQARAYQHAPERGVRYYISQAYAWAENYLIAAGFTVLTFVVRLLILILTLPLFATAAFVGFIDGLVRRDIRKFGAGRESGFLYHRAKAALLPIAVLPWLAYLALPISLHPLALLLPCAFLLGLAMNITAATFKKYL